ncbi:MAG TPA: glycyl-radical enzyme activating protein [Candidatus Hydrogenedentes bacterium]|nr:glycyl-radical enzyme activating protein [Candidatus Hydrogenedentota bacterium]
MGRPTRVEMTGKLEEETVQGVVFDIQRMSIHDGPGIRTTVFLKGCPLNCVWCHNPEGYSKTAQLAFSPDLCIGCGYCFEHCPNNAHVMVDGEHRIDREQCRACFACVEECYSQALEVVGKTMTVAEVLGEVLKDKAFYEESGGGMTLSGGEPLGQPEFSRALLEGAKASGLHTCVETCGLGAPVDLDALAPFVDVFLFDYKETDPGRHRAYTGRSNAGILDNLRRLDERGAAILLRCPIIPGLNLRDDHIRGIAELAQSLEHCQAVQIMGYHALAGAKRARLGIAGTPPELGDLHEMSRDEIESVVAQLRRLGAANVTPD